MTDATTERLALLAARSKALHQAAWHEATWAMVAHGQEAIARSLRLLAATAPRVTPPARDPGRRAAALGPELARAVMRLRAQPRSGERLLENA